MPDHEVDTQVDTLVSASVYERDLYEHLTEHVRRERALLERYTAAAEATKSKALAYVVRLLTDDERRHHILFGELAASLRHSAEFAPGEPAIPRLDFDRVDGSAVRDLSRELIAGEQADAAALKKLRKRLRDLEDTTLWSLIVELMEHDTQKHIAMLRFVEKHS